MQEKGKEKRIEHACEKRMSGAKTDAHPAPPVEKKLIDSEGESKGKGGGDSKFDLPSCLLLLLNIRTDKDFVEPEKRRQIDLACQTLTCGHPEPTRTQLFLFPDMISHFADIWCMTTSQPSQPVTHGLATFGVALLTYYVTGQTEEEVIQFNALNELLRRILERTHIIPTTGDCVCTRSTVEYTSKNKSGTCAAIGNRASRRQALKQISRPGCICHSRNPSAILDPKVYTQGFSTDWHEVASGLLYYLLIGGGQYGSKRSASVPPSPKVESQLRESKSTVESKSLFLGGQVEVTTLTNLLYILFATQLHPVLLRHSHLTPTELLLMTLNADTHNFMVSDDYVFKGISKTDAGSFRLRYSPTVPHGEQPHVLFKIDAVDLPDVILEIRRILARLVGKREHQSQMVSWLSHAAADALVGEYIRRSQTCGSRSERPLQLRIQSSTAEFLQLASVSIRLLTRDDFENKSLLLSCDGESRSGYGLATVNTPLSSIETRTRRTMLLKKSNGTKNWNACIELDLHFQNLYVWAHGS